VFTRGMFRLGWFDGGGAGNRGSTSGVISSQSLANAQGHTIPRKPLPVGRRWFGIDAVRSDGAVEEAERLTRSSVHP